MDLKAYLRYFGWSQADLARSLGVTPETISRWDEPPHVVMLYLGEKWLFREFRRKLIIWAEDN